MNYILRGSRPTYTSMAILFASLVTLMALVYTGPKLQAAEADIEDTLSTVFANVELLSSGSPVDLFEQLEENTLYSVGEALGPLEVRRRVTFLPRDDVFVLEPPMLAEGAVAGQKGLVTMWAAEDEEGLSLQPAAGGVFQVELERNFGGGLPAEYSRLIYPVYARFSYLEEQEEDVEDSEEPPVLTTSAEEPFFWFFQESTVNGRQRVKHVFVSAHAAGVVTDLTPFLTRYASSTLSSSVVNLLSGTPIYKAIRDNDDRWISSEGAVVDYENPAAFIHSVPRANALYNEFQLGAKTIAFIAEDIQLRFSIQEP